MAKMTGNGTDARTGAGVEVEYGQTIQAVEPAGGPKPEGASYLTPGFIDLQVNGFDGVDYNNPGTSTADIARSIRKMWTTGVTRCYPTVITGSPADMLGSLRNLARARCELLSGTHSERAGREGSTMEGFHVEGPHIAAEEGPRGAHPERWVRPPDLQEYKQWQDTTEGHVRLVTVSPHWPNAPRYIEALVTDGVVVSIGHTSANSQQIADAVSAGASMSTHLGNGSHPTLPKGANYILDQLVEDRLMAGVIADGVHLNTQLLKVILRCKTSVRCVLVTDASAPAGATPGKYRLGEQEVVLTGDHHVVLASSGRLAGSALLMHNGISILVRYGGLSLTDAVAMATTNAARAGRIANRQHGLETGERADMVRFTMSHASSRVTVEQTIVDGVSVYHA